MKRVAGFKSCSESKLIFDKYRYGEYCKEKHDVIWTKLDGVRFTEDNIKALIEFMED